MIGRSSSFLGVAVSDHSVACAEVSVHGDRRTVRRTAVFVFPPETTLDSPDAAGQALAAFLRQKRFAATRAVVGVPARWLIAVEKEVPPASEDQTRATLRLQAERLAVAEHGEVVFDFAGRANPMAPAKVLLVGMLRGRMEKVERMMDAAGMSVLAVTSSGLALASAARQTDTDGGVLILGRNGGEIVFRQGGAPSLLRHVPVIMNGRPDSADIAPLGSELRRVVATAQQNGTASARQVLLLDGLGLAKQDVADLSARAGIDVRAADSMEVLGIQTAELESGKPPGGLAPAMSLALAAAKTDLIPVDFKHSRLTPAPPQRVSRRSAWAIGIGAAALVAIIALFVSVHRQQSEYDELTAKLSSPQFKEQTAAAQASIDRLKYGRGFLGDYRPLMLDSLLDFTHAFREEERIWATSFNLRENGKGTLSGKAADQKTILTVLDRLKKQKRLSFVTIVDSRETDTRTHEWTFTLSFNVDLAE